MEVLEYLAESVRSTVGLKHEVALHQLRDYLKTTNEDEVLRQINNFTKYENLRAILEAGARTRIREAVTGRAAMLMRRE